MLPEPDWRRVAIVPGIAIVGVGLWMIIKWWR
jgi:hypothetical protein